MKNGNKFNFLYNLANPVIFDSSGEFAYIPINKAGQRSIARELLKDRVVIKKDNKEAWKLHADKFLNESDWAKLTTFGICRHPLDKFISAYFYLSKKGRIDPCNNINDFIFKNLSYDSNPNKINLHFQTQHNAFFFKKQLLVKHLIPLEDIYQQLPILLNVLNIKTSIPHKNKGSNKKYKTLLNNDSIKILESVYSKDLSMLGYNLWSKNQ